MTERWYQEKKREAFYRRAKKEGYRARSAYKLMQIQEKFSVIRKGDTVLDLGAAPGGWSQVAVELVSPGGRVIGLDLDTVDPLGGATFLRGDFTKPETVDLLRREMGRDGAKPVANTVLSDLSPDITGTYNRDQAESAFLVTKAIEFAESVLDRGGNFVAKVFEGEDYPGIVALLRARFDMVKPYRPPATRSHSSEVYLVAKGYRGLRGA